MKDLLQHIERLKTQLDQLRPLGVENQQRLEKKFRMEWNYNSNHIEGNTLTYGETELLLIFGETKGNHEFREYEEMKGHDVALKLIEDLAHDTERNLSENFIRELNLAILKEPFYKEAITPDGQPTRRLIRIGEYKSLPNSVRLQNGEIFDYASPAETPAKMGDLISWYLQVVENKDLHPVEVAADLHYKFVCIHPFDDGNGRISRLLMNYHLIKNGHPPVIIKTEDKKSYLFALHEADTGNLDAFKSYIAEQLMWSYEISIKAAKGENIDEPGDWEKKIELLAKQLSTKEKADRKKNKDVIIDLFKNSITPLIKLLSSKIKLLEDFYSSCYFNINVDDKAISGKSFVEMLDNVLLLLEDKTTRLSFNQHLSHFQQNGTDTFDSYYIIQIYFSDLTYSISINNQQPENIKKLNSHYLTSPEIESMVSSVTDKIYLQIEQRIKN